MVYDCGAWVAKYFLCLANFIIFLTGTFVLGVGIWLAVDKNSFIGLSKIVPVDELDQFTHPAVIQQASYVFIAVGGFMFIISFLGYCGALRESQCMLTTYGICVLLILILEITGAVLAVVYKSKAEVTTKDFLKHSIEKYYHSHESRDAVTLTWDHLQSTLQCCGVDNYEDFKTAKNFTQSGKVVPESCCVLEGDPVKLKPLSASCTTSPNSVNSYYKNGCYQALRNWIMSHLTIVLGILIGVGLFELIGIFFAFCLTKSVNQYSKH